jgi:hypothetical protein
MKRSIFTIALAGLVASSSLAVLVTGFESPDYSGTPGGVQLNGQQGWYNPVTGSIEPLVYTYAGNALGFGNNPTGGQQFFAGTATTNPARAQRDIDFSVANQWTLSYDFAALYTGTPPAADNLGSFSVQNPNDPSFRGFIALNRWVDTANPVAWKAEYHVFDADGNGLLWQSAGSEWMNLPVNRWFRQSTTINFTTNQILSVSITDILTNTTTTVNPQGWYMTGGANPTGVLPGAIRMFSGFGATGNTMGWDNVEVVPEPASLLALGAGAALMARRRRRG